MPKENTHLYFCHELIDKLPDRGLKQLIENNLEAYYLGSVIPDTFYYSGKEEMRKISEELHGRFGNLTNLIVFEMLGRLERQGSEADLAFILGFLTHAALDIVFHPMIYYYSGNYYSRSREKRQDAVYLHRHLETCLDAKVNPTYFFHDLINPLIVSRLKSFDVFQKRFGIKRVKIRRLLIFKNFLNRLLKIDLMYPLANFFYRVGFIRFKFLLGLFYGTLRRDPRVLPERLEYRDIITGERQSSTAEELFERADNFALEMMAAAANYFAGSLSREEASQFIRGESFNTGRVGVSVKEIKFTYDSKT